MIMKKYLYTLVGALALIFAACSNDAPEYELTFNDTPAAIAASGEYSGLWTRILGATKDTIRDKQGAIIFSVDTVMHELDSATTTTNYYANINFVCDELKLNVSVANTNIAYSNDGFVFFNDNASSPSNGLKRAFAGRIDGDGNLSIEFPLTQRVSGRIRKFEYSFYGTRTPILSE